MTIPFPLLRLPRLALIPVLQSMELIEVIAFSLLSNRARNLIKMFSISTYVSSINLSVHADYLSIRAFQRNDEPVELRFNTATVSSDETLKWLERVLEVIDADSIEQVDLHESPRRDDVCEALTTLKEVRGLYIMANCTNRFAKKALKILTPVTSETVMFKIPFKNRKEMEMFMKSSTKSLTIFADRFSKFKYSIHAFLVSNSLRLKLKQWSLSEHSINQFLTKWLQNEHNSPLEHLSMDNDENFYMPHVLKGLDAVPFLEERAFHYSAQLDIPPKTIFGGYDIRGMNGKKVTITYGMFQSCIDFYVWP